MRLPPKKSSYEVHVRYGRYVAQRLRRAGLVAMANDATNSIQVVKETGRAWEDADEPVQGALADRDAADDDLDLAAQTLRANLAGRGPSADKQAPYTMLFPHGIGYYTAAPLDEEEKRYGELKQRIQDHLPADDAPGQAARQAIDAGLEAFRQGVTALQAAEVKESLAGTRARSSIAAFVRQMEKTYGSLLQERGKAAAERFFPKVRRGPDDGGTPHD